MWYRRTGFESSSSIRPGSKIVGIRPAEANTARNSPNPYRNAASAPCTPRTMLVTSCARSSLPKSETVARAPSTTSIFMRKMKNRITAVEQPKNPQKILRANASRKVSRTSASVTIPGLLPIHGPHEYFFQRTLGTRHSFDLALFSAQQIHGVIGHLATGEEECHGSIL